MIDIACMHACHSVERRAGPRPQLRDEREARDNRAHLPITRPTRSLRPNHSTPVRPAHIRADDNRAGAYALLVFTLDKGRRAQSEARLSPRSPRCQRQAETGPATQAAWARRLLRPAVTTAVQGSGSGQCMPSQQLTCPRVWSATLSDLPERSSWAV